MRFSPRPYQIEIADHVITNHRCAVWAGMGLGKSCAVLTAIEQLRLTDGLDGPALVIAPLRVAASTWPAEAAKWDHLKHLKVVPIIGDAKQREKAAKLPADVFTVNYENIPWLVEYLGASRPSVIVIDEATKLKGHRLRQGSVRTQALAKIAHDVPRFIELTGTPSPQGLIDLWGQIWFLDQGERLGKSFKAFADRWFYNTSRDPQFQILAPHNFAEEQISERLKDLCLTVDPADYFDLEEPIRNVITVQLPTAALDVYDSMEKELFAEMLTGDVEAVNAAAKSAKCLQIASGFLYDEGKNAEVLHDVKLDVLASVIEEANGAPVLVAYHFKADLDRLLKRFSRGRVLDANPKTIDDWNAGKIPVLFAHPASAGHGLNLQDGGNILVFFGLWWDLEQHQQIIERIGPVRQMQAGHKRPVFIHYIVAKDTIDEDVLKRLETKASVQELLLERMKRC